MYRVIEIGDKLAICNVENGRLNQVTPLLPMGSRDNLTAMATIMEADGELDPVYIDFVLTPRGWKWKCADMWARVLRDMRTEKLQEQLAGTSHPASDTNCLEAIRFELKRRGLYDKSKDYAPCGVTS